ncbi:MAG: hypothetical protein LUG98_01135, partial [Tannerellaceae bacterium]|nr:hypothetical protein [Tannerellaceae bacterium]
MAVQNKLDVYKIILKKRGDFTFRDLIKKKYQTEKGVNHTDSKLFNLLYKEVLVMLTKEIWKHGDSKMGLTLFKARGEKENTVLTSHSKDFVLEGYIDGGPYDMIRRLANLSGTKKQKINKNDIITDRYYIYMHLPLDSNIGIVFLQSKS